MNFIKSAVNSSSGSNSQEQNTEQKSNEGGGGFLGGIGDKLNTAAGGGKESEKNEDLLDKGPSSLHQIDDSNIVKGLEKENEIRLNLPKYRSRRGATIRLGSRGSKQRICRRASQR